MRTLRIGLATGLALICAFGVAQAGTAVYFEGVANHSKSRPPDLFLTGNGTLYVYGVHWNSWGGRVALGRGTASYHGGGARVQHAAVNVQLSNIRTCSGRRYYTHVHLTKENGQALDPGYLARSWNPCHP
jgi:hypothetical protein